MCAAASRSDSFAGVCAGFSLSDLPVIAGVTVFIERALLLITLVREAAGVTSPEVSGE